MVEAGVPYVHQLSDQADADMAANLHCWVLSRMDKPWAEPIRILCEVVNKLRSPHKV